MVRHVATCKQQQYHAVVFDDEPKTTTRKKREQSLRGLRLVFSYLTFQCTHQHFCHSLCSLLCWLLRCIAAVLPGDSYAANIHMDRHTQKTRHFKQNEWHTAHTPPNTLCIYSEIKRTCVYCVCCVCCAALVFKLSNE